MGRSGLNQVASKCHLVPCRTQQVLSKCERMVALKGRQSSSMFCASGCCPSKVETCFAVHLAWQYYEIMFSEQHSANYMQPMGQSWPPVCFAHQVLLELSYRYCLWLLCIITAELSSCGREHMIAEMKIFIVCPLLKMFCHFML